MPAACNSTDLDVQQGIIPLFLQLFGVYIPEMKSIKGILICVATVLFVFVAYSICARTVYPPAPERETFPGEGGAGFDEAGVWGVLFICARTLLQLSGANMKVYDRICSAGIMHRQS